MVQSMLFEAPLVVTYGSRLSASTPWAIVSVPVGVGAAAAAGGAVGAATCAGAVVGFGAGGAVGAATGGVVGLAAGAAVGGGGAGAAVGWVGAFGAQAARTLTPVLKPSNAPSRTNSRRFMALAA